MLNGDSVQIGFVQLGLVPMLVGLLASLLCALLGNFLVLRRQSLIGDAISHVVLPGIVGVFLITGDVATGPVLLGAMAAALCAVGLIAAIRHLGRVESGAAMGVVFTAMFAAGVLWLEQSRASSVHLDVEHVLYGNLESLIWFDAEGWHSLLDAAALSGLPPELLRIAVVFVLAVAFVRVLWRPLVLGSFDAGFAHSVGARPGWTGLALMAMVALAAVAVFDAVGSIIVVAMLVCPAAAARLMSRRLPAQIAWSMAFGAMAALTGHVLAAWGPLWLGFEASLSAAGMIAVMGGLLLAAACAWGPERRPAG